MTLNQHPFDPYDWNSFIELFEAQAACYRDRVFVHYQTSDTELEFKTLTYDQFNRIASYLAQHWLPQLVDIQCVAFLGGNHLQSLLAMVAISKLGKTFFPLSTGNSVAANTHLLSKTGVRYLITSEEYSQKAHTRMSQLDGVRGHIWHSFDAEELITLAATSNSGFSNNQQTSDDIPLILQSSGTTGLPKPIYLSNRWLIVFLAVLRRKTKPNGEPLLGDAETVMTTFSAYHSGGTLAYWLPVTMGGSAILFREEPPSTADLLTVIQTRKVTGMIVAPIHLESLAKLLQAKGVDGITRDGLKKIKFCLYGGAPIATELGEFLQVNGMNIGNAYGTTETSNILLASYSRNDKNYDRLKPNEFASQHIKWELHDNNGLYHLMIRNGSPLLSPTAVASIGTSGYYETNDLFREDPPKSGYWRHIRRIDDIIVLSDGGKTDPVVLENEIRNASIVKHCAVVGHNRSITAVLIEINLDYANKRPLNEVNSEVYKAVRAANKIAAQKHSHIAVPDMVYILPPHRRLPITSKGTVVRKEVLQQFEKEIKKMYDDYVLSFKAVSSNTPGNGSARIVAGNYHLQSKL